MTETPNQTATAAAPQAPEYVPPPADVKEAEEILNIMQRILVRMGTDERRESGEFKEILGQYKELGSELHRVKKVTAAQAPARAAGRTPSGTAAPMSALDRAKQLRGAPYTAPQPLRRPPGPAAGPAAAPTAAPAPGAAAAAAAAYARAGTPTDEDGTSRPVPQPVPMAIPNHLKVAPGEPLPLPKFTGTLGPAGRPGVLSEGDEVTNLQSLLNHLGYEVPVTGIYDLKTARAMQNYQQDNDLPVNGMLGLQARKLLNEHVTGE